MELKTGYGLSLEAELAQQVRRLGAGFRFAAYAPTDATVDIKAFEAILEWQISEGTHGFVPCGTTGESPALIGVPRRTVQAVLPSDPDKGYVVIYELPTNGDADRLVLAERTRLMLDSWRPSSRQVAVQTVFARVKVPKEMLPRFVPVVQGEETFVLLEDLIAAAERELEEETGVVSADLLARTEGWITGVLLTAKAASAGEVSTSKPTMAGPDGTLAAIATACRLVGRSRASKAQPWSSGNQT